MDLSRTKGFYRLTMDELAAEAGLSKRTLYRYFRSKDEIIEAALDQLMAEVAVKIDRFLNIYHKPEDITAELLKVLYHIGRVINNPLVLDDLRQHYPHYWKKIDDFRLEKVQNIIKCKFFLDEKNKDYVRDLNPTIVTAAILASVQAVANPEFILTNGLTFNETISQLLEFIQHGILKDGYSKDNGKARSN